MRLDEPRITDTEPNRAGLPLPCRLDHVVHREVGTEVVHLPAALLDISKTGQEPPLVPFAWEACREADRAGAARIAEAGLEGVHHDFTRHVLGGNGNLAQSPEVAHYLRQREHHLAGKAAEPPHSQLLADEALQAALEASGDGWLTTTRLRGATYLRAGIVNYLSTEDDIDRLLATLRRLAAET